MSPITSLCYPRPERLSCRTKTNAISILTAALLCLAIAFTSPSDLRADDSARGGAVAWLDVVRDGNVVHFLWNSPREVRRYDLSTGVWLSPIAVPGIGRAPMSANSTAIFVRTTNAGSGRDEIWRTPLATNVPALLYTSELDPAAIQGLHATDNWLIVQQRNQGTASLDPATGTVLDRDTSAVVTNETDGKAPGALVGSRFFSRYDVSPPHVFYLDVDTDGTFLGPDEDVEIWRERFPDVGALFGADGLLYSDVGPILDSSGIFEWYGTLAGGVSSFGFAANPSWVLAAYDTNELIVSTRTGTPVGWVDGVGHAEGYGDQLALFAPDGTASWMDNADVAPRPRSAAIPPYEMGHLDSFAYTPNGVMHMLDNENLTIHRFSVEHKAWLAGVPIAEPAVELIEGPTNLRVYVRYASNSFTWIEGTNSNPAPPEGWFANSPWEPYGVVEIGGSVNMFTPATTSTTFSNVYDMTGVLQGTLRGAERPYGLTYDSAAERLYVLIGPSANILSALINPLTGEGISSFESPDDGLNTPIRVSGDSARVSESTGLLLAAADLSQMHDFGQSHADASFDDVNNLATIRQSTPGQTRVEVWDADDFSLIGSRNRSGTPQRVVFHDGEFFVFTTSPGNGVGVRIGANTANDPATVTFTTTHDTIGTTSFSVR